MLKPALLAHFTRYADSHRHPVNRLTHELAIPLIVFHVIAMLSWIVVAAPHGHALSLGHIAYVGVIAWYFALDARLAVLMALLYGMCFPIAAVTPRSVVVVFAIVGWAIQLAGHVVWEKRSPAFLTNLLQALIGPLFFAAVLVGMWPVAETSETLPGGRSVS
jgi:uncharacterized membrane protein YGL010W